MSSQSRALTTPAKAHPSGSLTSGRRQQSRSAARAVPIDMGRLRYVRLPKAPLSWEQAQTTVTSQETASDEMTGGRQSAPRFVVSEGLVVISEAKLPASEKPGTAYKKMYPAVDRTIWIDPKGGRDPFSSAPAAALVTDREGARFAERPLSHNVYRTDVSADGSSMLFLSAVRARCTATLTLWIPSCLSR